MSQLENIDLNALSSSNLIELVDSLRDDRLAPDDSGKTWKAPRLWTPEDIHNLVIQEVGVDENFPRGYQVLVMLYTPPEIDPLTGLYNTDKEIREVIRSTTIGKILRMGKDAFNDRRRFPSGPLVTYGEWALFKGLASNFCRIKSNGKALSLLTDERFLERVENPDNLDTIFDIQYEHIGV